MANTLSQAAAYARATPRRDGKSWSGWCASFNFRAGAFSTPYPTATAAGDAAGVLSGILPAPAGAQHYWGGVGGDGHCSIELGGGLQLMASSAVTDRWGTDMGTIMLDAYNRARPAAIYRGWSMNWGSRDRLAGTASSGQATPTKGPTVMDRFIDANGDIYLRGPGGIVHIETPQDDIAVTAVLAGRNADGSRVTFDQVKAAERYFIMFRTGY